MFLEDWKLLADKEGNIEEVDGVWDCKSAENKCCLTKGSCHDGQLCLRSRDVESCHPPVVVCNCFCVPCRKVSGAAYLPLMGISNLGNFLHAETHWTQRHQPHTARKKNFLWGVWVHYDISAFPKN